jgi:excisionase family DNA binding protein
MPEDNSWMGGGAGDPGQQTSRPDRDVCAGSSTPMGERLALSVEEAGALLGISRDLAYDLVAIGQLPSVRLGRRLVVPRRALEEALNRLADAG